MLDDDSHLRRKALPAILLLAFLLRVWQLDLVHFSIDESMAAAIATRVGMLDYFPLTGIRTSFHFNNPPLLFYLLAPFFALSPSPTFAALLLVGLGTAAVYWAFRSGEILGGARCGLIAAAIIAVSPNAVEYSRRLWGHDFIVPCSAAAIYGALLAVRSTSWKPLALSFTAAVAAQSLHLSGIVLWLPGLAVLALRRPARWPLALAAAATMLLLSYAPWLVNELREDFPGMRAIIGQLAGGAAARDLGLPVSPHTAWALVLADFWMNDLLITPRPWMLSEVAAVASLLVTCLALLFLALAIARTLFALGEKDEERAFAAILLLPLLGTLLLFGILFRASVPPYLLPALVPAALGAAWSLRRLRREATILLIVYAAASLLLIASVRVAIASGAGGGIPLREKRAAIQLVAEIAEHRSFRLVQDGRSPAAGVDLAYEYLAHEAGIHEQHRTEAEHLFVIVDPRTRIRPQLLLFLKNGALELRADHQLQRLRVYEVPPERHGEWLAMLEAYSPGSR